MRVLAVNLAKAVGGSSFHARDLAEGLAQLGDTVTLLDRLAPPASASYHHQRTAPGRQMLDLWRLIRAFRPDVIHAHQSLASRLANRLKGDVPVVATLHGVYKARSHAAAEGIIRIADHQAAAMAGFRGQSVTLWNWRREGLPPLARAEARERLGLPPEVFVFGTVSRLVRDKGVDDLISAFRALPQPSARLVLIGGGAEEAALKALAAGDGRIVFTGHLDDAPRLMTGFDCFVMPSHAEAFPLVLIEALAAGRPIIATNTRGGAELLRGQGAIMVPSGDGAALGAAMAAMLATPPVPPAYDLTPFARERQIARTRAFLSDIARANAAHRLRR